MSDLFDVHLCIKAPEDRTERVTALNRERVARDRVLESRADLDWTMLGLQPRWLGDDASLAVAAFEPSSFSGSGHEEWVRFSAGAARRGDTALCISTVDAVDQPPLAALLGVPGSRVRMPYLEVGSTYYIACEDITVARPPQVPSGLVPVDRDLALRIKDTHPTDARWVALKPTVRDARDDVGGWIPLLETPDGRVVAGVWTGEDENGSAIRHYVLPSLPTYEPVMRWLVERAVPELVPHAAARSRRYIADMPAFQSVREQALSTQIAELSARFERESKALERELEGERDAVTPVRDSLLFGSGSRLEDAVATVLRSAGLTVRPLDEELGGTVSADFAVELSGSRHLVEVKSSSGNASERLVEAVHRHLTTWGHLRPGEPVTGGVLIVNHQHRTPPAERDIAVFQREEFVRSLDVPVISTLQLFNWWRLGDVARIRGVFDGRESSSTTPLRPNSLDTLTEPTEGRRRWWPGIRRTRS